MSVRHVLLGLTLGPLATAAPAWAFDNPIISFDNPIISLSKGDQLTMRVRDAGRLQVHTYLVQAGDVVGGKATASTRLAKGDHDLSYAATGGFAVAAKGSVAVMPGDDVTIELRSPKELTVDASKPFGEQWPALVDQAALGDAAAVVVYAAGSKGRATATVWTVRTTSLEGGFLELCGHLSLCE